MELKFTPSPEKWAQRAGVLVPRAAKFREQMGLPASGPLVLSGHQAELWHGGILAKHFASLAFASRERAQTAWIVVDQDEADAIGLRVPIRDTAGRLREMRWQWGESAGRISSGIAPVTPRAPALKAGESFAIVSVAEAIGFVSIALAKHSKESSWAKQVSAAAAEIIARSAPAPQFVYESKLASTELFQQIVEAIARGDAEAIRGYNQAILSTGDSGMRPLDEATGELPLWDVGGGRRRRVLAADFGKLDRSQLAPRGMLMTAVLRLAGCDLFVHGIGGGAYDPATEAWIAGWDGELATLAAELGGVGALAPMAVATADLRLPLAKPGLPTDEEIRHGVWLAHHAGHDPAALGDERGAAEKARLLAEIRENKSKQESPAQAFHALHALLAESRRTRSSKLAELENAARNLKEQRSEAKLAFDRTWSFALQAPTEIGGMYEQAVRAFEGRD